MSGTRGSCSSWSGRLRQEAALLWVICCFGSHVANRLYYTDLALNRSHASPTVSAHGPRFFWRETEIYPVHMWVIAILAFVGLTPPDS